MDNNYSLDAIRKKLKDKGSKARDPNEFIPRKAESASDADKYRFYILPPVSAGDKVNGGVASKSMDSFALAHGMHWYQRRPYACPRLIYEDTCCMCQTGFDLAKDVEDKKQRAAIFKDWMPNQQFYVNIYFPNTEINKDLPEELLGRVMYYAAPKTVYDVMYAAIFRDSYGDPSEPEGFGAFFDPKRPLLFSLNVKKASGQSENNKSYNDYKSSKFIVNVNQENGKHTFGQLAKAEEAVQAILDSRFDLWSKIELPDTEKLNKLQASILNGFGGEGGGGSGGNSGFQDEPQHEQPKAAASGTVKTGKLSTPKPEPVSEETAPESDSAQESSSDESPMDEEIATILAKLKKK